MQLPFNACKIGFRINLNLRDFMTGEDFIKVIHHTVFLYFDKRSEKISIICLHELNRSGLVILKRNGQKITPTRGVFYLSHYVYDVTFVEESGTTHLFAPLENLVSDSQVYGQSAQRRLFGFESKFSA
jgi:hypothetical protein